MTDTKKEPRTLESINQEYTALCAQLGQKHYQVTQANKDLEALVSAIRDINTEAAQSKQYYDAKAKSEAQEAQVDNVTPISGAV